MAAVAITVLGAFLYLIGYAYLDGFYEYYDVSLSELQFGIQYILAHSAIPFLRSELLSVNSIIIALILPLIVLGYRVVRSAEGLDPATELFRISKYFATVYVGYILITTFLSAHSIGKSLADSEFEKLNRVQVSEGFLSAPISELIASSDRGTLYYLVSSGSRHYFVVKFERTNRRYVVHVEDTEIGPFFVYQTATRRLSQP